MRKKIIGFIAAIMLFSIVGPASAETVANNSEEELSQPKNNTDLTDSELLNLNIKDLVGDPEIVQEVQDVDQQMGSQELKELEESILDLSSEDILIDEETLAYRDTINPDIDVQELIQAEEKITAELHSDTDIDQVEGLVAASIIRGIISAVTALFKKYGLPAIKATWHLAERMHERKISPAQVFNAVTKGKKYYDPEYKSSVYYYDGVAVARQGNSLTTTYKSAKPKDRWQ